MHHYIHWPMSYPLISLVLDKIFIVSHVHTYPSLDILFLQFMCGNEVSPRIIIVPLWLWNRLISRGLEPVLSHTEKSCIASNYRQFSTNHKNNISFVSPGLRPLGSNKICFLLIIFHFNVHRKLSDTML